MINWNSSEIHFLHNPRIPASWKSHLAEVQHGLPTLPGHIWILTSGTSRADQWKWVALSKHAFLVSAESVNKRLNVSPSDIWLRVIPAFHVGGLSIEARCALSGSKWVDFTEKWNAERALEILKEKGVTLVSLVPAQLHDLVQLEQKAPASLRSVIIGGGALSQSLHERAEMLGYNVLPSYGMTECASQIATGLAHKPNDGTDVYLQLLDHIDVRLAEDGILQIKSEALLTGMATVTFESFEYKDPKIDGWYRTEDMVLLQERALSVLGREGEVVKVGGEIVSLPRLRMVLDSVGAQGQGTVMSVPDERLGRRIVHIYQKQTLHTDFPEWLKLYGQHTLPFEAPKEIYFVDRLPRTELGKIRWGQLRATLGFEQE